MSFPALSCLVLLITLLTWTAVQAGIYIVYLVLLNRRKVINKEHNVKLKRKVPISKQNMLQIGCGMSILFLSSAVFTSIFYMALQYKFTDMSLQRLLISILLLSDVTSDLCVSFLCLMCASFLIGFVSHMKDDYVMTQIRAHRLDKILMTMGLLEFFIGFVPLVLSTLLFNLLPTFTATKLMYIYIPRVFQLAFLMSLLLSVGVAAMSSAVALKKKAEFQEFDDSHLMAHFDAEIEEPGRNIYRKTSPSRIYKLKKAIKLIALVHIFIVLYALVHGMAFHWTGPITPLFVTGEALPGVSSWGFSLLMLFIDKVALLLVSAILLTIMGPSVNKVMKIVREKQDVNVDSSEIVSPQQALLVSTEKV